ncbi:acetyl-CoA hydrolase/transferase C-terminal domain-containing protein [Emticicia sp. W12TSBA100-4]|uniref:acetyl-CoA hydrolase/transferase C-terminal domain-containing protein n=1 Tax=Emticicia sp. W12TSBA100-4 TaxID=3160965 RepID=UPI003305DC93
MTVDDNPLITMMRVNYMNDTSIIRRNPKVTTINSAIDITSQICTDNIGDHIY